MHFTYLKWVEIDHKVMHFCTFPLSPSLPPSSSSPIPHFSYSPLLCLFFPPFPPGWSVPLNFLITELCPKGHPWNHLVCWRGWCLSFGNHISYREGTEVPAVLSADLILFKPLSHTPRMYQALWYFKEYIHASLHRYTHFAYKDTKIQRG